VKTPLPEAVQPHYERKSGPSARYEEECYQESRIDKEKGRAWKQLKVYSTCGGEVQRNPADILEQENLSGFRSKTMCVPSTGRMDQCEFARRKRLGGIVVETYKNWQPRKTHDARKACKLSHLRAWRARRIFEWN